MGIPIATKNQVSVLIQHSHHFNNLLNGYFKYFCGNFYNYTLNYTNLKIVAKFEKVKFLG